MPGYRRVIVKLSGEALSGPEAFGIHQPTIDRFAADIVAARSLGVTIGAVVGGGNVLRGVQVAAQGVSRPTGDAMGMLATVMNALVLEAAIERAGASARTMSALTMPQVCETYERARALRHLDDNRVVVFAGGTGGFTSAWIFSAAVNHSSDKNTFATGHSPLGVKGGPNYRLDPRAVSSGFVCESEFLWNSLGLSAAATTSTRGSCGPRSAG